MRLKLRTKTGAAIWGYTSFLQALRLKLSSELI